MDIQQKYKEYIQGRRALMSPGERKVDVEIEEMSMALIRIMNDPSRRTDYLKIRTLLEQSAML